MTWLILARESLPCVADSWPRNEGSDPSPIAAPCSPDFSELCLDLPVSWSLELLVLEGFGFGKVAGDVAVGGGRDR